MQLYRPLIWMAPNLTIDFTNSHASSIEVSENNTLFRVHLHPWIWSDGVPVTADDVIYSMEIIKQLGASYFGWGADGMPDLFASLRAADPLTLEVRTPHPVNPEWFEAGEIDVATIPFSTYKKVSQLPGYRVVKLPPLPTYNGLYYNLRNPKVAFFKDVRVRQAIADAINQKAIIDVIYRGNGVPIYGPVPPANATFLSPDARAGRYPIGYDPAHARALLQQAGFSPGPDGIMQKDGVRLAMTALVSANNGDRLLIGEFVQADLAKIGIQFNLQQMDFNQLRALAYRSTDGWEASFIGSSFPSFPDLGATFTSTAQQNFSHVEDPLTDRLLDQLANTPGREALYAAQDRISETQPQLFLPSGNAPLLARDGVEGYEQAIQSNFLWKPEYLRLTGSRACPTATASKDSHAPG